MSDKHSKVSLEDLLKLKKCEKPQEEFWSKFDRDLQSKMLQSMVKKPSLFNTTIDLIRSHFRSILTTSAAAAFTLTLLVCSSTNILTTNNSSSKNSALLLANSSIDAKKHFLQNSIIDESQIGRNFTKNQLPQTSFSSGIQYITGSLATIHLDSAVQSKFLY